jgi:hypothetical protein
VRGREPARERERERTSERACVRERARQREKARKRERGYLARKARSVPAAGLELSSSARLDAGNRLRFQATPEFFFDNLLVRTYLIIEMIFVHRPCTVGT